MESQTSATLLARLRQVPADQAAWMQFSERCGRKTYARCRRWNSKEAGAEGVTQDVLLRLAGKVRTFVYDPAGGSRARPKAVARHARGRLLVREGYHLGRNIRQFGFTGKL